MKSFNIKITVQKGKICFNREKVKAYFEALKDGEYLLNCEQQAYYKGRYKFYRGKIIPCIMEKLGYFGSKENDQIHEFCKRKFCKVPVFCLITGEMISATGGSTTKLTDDQFREFQEDVMAFFAQELGIDFSHLFTNDNG